LSGAHASAEVESGPFRQVPLMVWSWSITEHAAPFARVLQAASASGGGPKGGGPGGGPPQAGGGGIFAGVHASEELESGPFRQVPLTDVWPWNLKLQVAPFARVLQAVSASGGGPCGLPNPPGGGGIFAGAHASEELESGPFRQVPLTDVWSWNLKVHAALFDRVLQAASASAGGPCGPPGPPGNGGILVGMHASE